MIITSKSIMSGLSRSKDIDVTYIQLLDWHQGALIQNAMPNVSSEDRDFIKGIFWNECGLDDIADVYSDDLDDNLNYGMDGDDYENS